MHPSLMRLIQIVYLHPFVQVEESYLVDIVYDTLGHWSPYLINKPQNVKFMPKIIRLFNVRFVSINHQ